MIEIIQLCKRFGSLTAVDDLTLTLSPGEVLGFLGPNGAGKSTTMKIVTGYLRPTSGRVAIYGNDVHADPLAVRSLVGYLPEGAPCYEEMTPRSFLRFIAEVRGYRGRERDERVALVSSQMSLAEVMDQRIETLSKGFKRRVGLAQAIIHDPKVLILDEPTDGLDPNQKHQVRELIRGLSKEKIVIISTHILEEVTAVCTRAVIIAKGRVVSDGKPSALEQQSRYHGAMTIRVGSIDAAESLVRRLAEINDIRAVERSADGTEVTAFPASDDVNLFDSLGELAADPTLGISGLYAEKGRIDEVFRSVTEGVAS